MDSYVKARDGWDVDARPCSSTHRRRSQSPPILSSRDSAQDSRPARDRELPRRDRLDYDAPAPILPCESSGSSASIPTATASHHTSSSRNALSGKPETSASRRISVATESRAEVLRRLLAGRAERDLFDQIEDKRFSIGEIRKERAKELEYIKVYQKHLNTGKPEHRDSFLTRLHGHQEKKSQLDSKIRAENDELYRMQLEWELTISDQCVPALVAAAKAPIEHRLDESRSEMRSNRTQDRERLEFIETRARQAAGQAERSQSEITKIKREVGNHGRELDRLFTLVTKSCKELRTDIDKDVVQISDNNKRIKALAQDVAFLKTQSTKVTYAAVSATSSRADSAAPPSPGSVSSPRPPSPVRDSRQPPQPPPTAAESASTSTAAPTPISDAPSSSTKTAEGASARTPAEHQVVTRPILAKWLRDFNQDLELRLDEIKDLAVQEATAENQTRTEERLGALLRKWKRRVARADGAGQHAPQASVDDVTDAPSSGSIPMEVESAGINGEANVSQPSQATEAFKGVDCQAGYTDADKDKVVAVPTNLVQSDPSAILAASASSSGAAPSRLDSVQSKSAPGSSASEVEAGKTTVVTSPASVVEAIRRMLKTQAMEIETIKKNQADALAPLFASPEKLDELLSLLKQHGLGQLIESAASAVPQLEASVNKIETALASLLASRLDERVKAMEESRSEMTESTDAKIHWLQKQLEVLDDQSSVQGALLVKLSEHANPRRAPAEQHQQNRTSLVQKLVNPPAHTLIRQQAGSRNMAAHPPQQQHPNRTAMVEQPISSSSYALRHPQAVSPQMAPQWPATSHHRETVVQASQPQQRQAQQRLYLSAPPYPGPGHQPPRGF